MARLLIAGPLVWLLLGLVVAVGAIALAIFNRLVALRQRVRGAWSDVDVYLKRRADLVPNLVQAVRAYADYEQETLRAVVEARQNALNAEGVGPRARAEQEVVAKVDRLIALAEAYPELRASEGFLRLQEDLRQAEKSIASARQYYNACVRDYNTAVESFPGNVVAALGGFRPAEFFELDDLSERRAPSIAELP